MSIKNLTDQQKRENAKTLIFSYFDTKFSDIESVFGEKCDLINLENDDSAMLMLLGRITLVERE